jgi:hypothetical protein
MRTALVLALVCTLAASQRATGAISRFSLASQYDWGAKRGFYLTFENGSQGDAWCSLETLRLYFGVADGTRWQFLLAAPRWQCDRDYRVKAVIGTEDAQLWLDGALAASSKGGFAPAAGLLTVNHIPYWASGPAQYLVVQESLKVSGGSPPVAISFARQARRPVPLILFEPQGTQRVKFRPIQGRTLTIEASFRLAAYPNLADLAPFVDRYGQCRYADWPGKVKSDRDLARAAEEEEARLTAWGAPKDYDRYGGYTRAGWRKRATGFYRVTQRDGFWWLVSPAGNPCFYTGICTAPAFSWDQTPVTGRESLFEWLPPRERPYGAAWGENPWGPDTGIKYVAPHTSNLIRKYGPDWQRKSRELMSRRLRAWGFSGIGKWGGMENTPYLPVLSRAAVPNLVKHPDVFDPQVQAKFREALRRQIEPHREDPMVVGWTVGSEVDEIIYKDEIAIVLQGPDSPAKRALVDNALAEKYQGDLGALARAWGAERAGNRDALYTSSLKPLDEDIEQARRCYAERYYDFIYRTVKELDPNHLYLGNYMIPGAWQNEEDWYMTARHCDVMGYDLYSNQFADTWFADLIARTGKPVLCGEFSYPAWYGGWRGFGMYGVWVEDDAASGEAYWRWLRAAGRNPYCVGAAWFQYRDQPVTGRGPGHGSALVYGEHFAFGMVDVTDRPKWDLVKRVRQANLQAPKWRLDAMRKGEAE